MNTNISLNSDSGRWMKSPNRNTNFTRRLSHSLGRMLRLDWNNNLVECGGSSRRNLNGEQYPKTYDINELVNKTKFTKSEIQFIYRDFKSNCPNGILTERGLIKIYSQIFSCGDCTQYAKHLFSAIIQDKNHEEIYFQDFLLSLSAIMKGTMDERIKWLFNFYDTNKDGRISKEEIRSMIKSLYDLMGPNVDPPVNQSSKEQHFENVLKKMNLDASEDKYLTFNDFYLIITQNQELVDSMMNLT